jgi:hypothetical protein
MTNCYWGTDEQILIEQYIWDANDFDDYTCVVEFLPFAGGPVPVEPTDWSSLKELFRDE